MRTLVAVAAVLGGLLPAVAQTTEDVAPATVLERFDRRTQVLMVEGSSEIGRVGPLDVTVREFARLGAPRERVTRLVIRASGQNVTARAYLSAMEDPPGDAQDFEAHTFEEMRGMSDDGSSLFYPSANPVLGSIFPKSALMPTGIGMRIPIELWAF